MLAQVGRDGFVKMIGDDINLARTLYDNLGDHPELERISHSLSITTFRYVPKRLRSQIGDNVVEEYLNKLNEELLGRIEKSGQLFLSNAIVDGRFALRLCIVNFRTSLEDIEAIPDIVTRLGSEVDDEFHNDR